MSNKKRLNNNNNNKNDTNEPGRHTPEHAHGRAKPRGTQKRALEHDQRPMREARVVQERHEHAHHRPRRNQHTQELGRDGSLGHIRSHRSHAALQLSPID